MSNQATALLTRVRTNPTYRAASARFDNSQDEADLLALGDVFESLLAAELAQLPAHDQVPIATQVSEHLARRAGAI